MSPDSYDFPSLPTTIPNGANYQEIETQIHLVLQAIKNERKQLQQQREEMEKLWEDPLSGVQISLEKRLETLEAINVADRQLTDREREVLEFYRVNFPRRSSTKTFLTVETLGPSPKTEDDRDEPLVMSSSQSASMSVVQSPKSTIDFDSTDTNESVKEETAASLPPKIDTSLQASSSKPNDNLKVVHPETSMLSPSAITPTVLSPFLQYLVDSRGKTEQSVNKTAEAGEVQDKTGKVATPKSSRSKTVSPMDKSNELKFTMTRSQDDPLDDFRRNLDKELENLDRALNITGSVSVMNSIDTLSSEAPATPLQIETSTTESFKRSLAPGWTVRFQEMGKRESFSDYKSAFVHQDASALEILLIALKKWRYLNPKTLEQMKGPRVIVTDELKATVNREGWQILMAPSQFTHDMKPLDFDQLIVEILPREPPTEFQPLFFFRKDPETKPPTLEFEYKLTTTFKPSYIFKLSSQFVVAENEEDQAVDTLNWSYRFMVLAKDRYLLLFKSEHHSRWTQNIMHEIDMGKVVKLRPTPLRRFKSTSEDNTTATSSNSFVIYTRTRRLYFCMDSEEERNAMLQQLQDVLTKLHGRYGPSTQVLPLGRGAHDKLERIASEASARSVFVKENPLQPLVDKLLSAGRLNAMEAIMDGDKCSIFLTQALKAHSISTLTKVMTSQRLMEPLDLLIAVRDGALAEANEKNGSTKISTMRKLINTITGGNGVATNSNLLSPSALAASKNRPPFGVHLDDLECDYSENEFALRIPALVRSSIAYLQENGLNTSGLFRVAGSAKRVETLKKVWESKYEHPDGAVDYTGYNVHDVAAVLKSFFRELPEPLLGARLYKAFLAASKIKEKVEQLCCFRYLMTLLVPSHRHVAEGLLRFLKKVSEHSEDFKKADGTEVKGNLMNSTNLAVCFGPNILRERHSEPGDSTPMKRSHSRIPSANGAGPTSSSSSLNEVGKSLEVADSQVVVEAVRILIEQVEEVFKIDEMQANELKRMAAAPAGERLLE